MTLSQTRRTVLSTLDLERRARQIVTSAGDLDPRAKSLLFHNTLDALIDLVRDVDRARVSP